MLTPSVRHFTTIYSLTSKCLPMAKLPLLPLSLSFLWLLHGSIATQQYRQQQNQCQINRLNALQPNDRVQAEGGSTEFWDSNNQQFQCAGVNVIRHRIQPRGLLLPSYSNAPYLSYITQGRGIQGVLLPGCPETYQSSKQFSQEGREEEGRRGERFQDRHQKIQHIRQGDVLAYPAGAAHWLYNDGENDLEVVVLVDTNNNQNQLDQSLRKFFLAGNPQQGQQGEWRSYKRGQQEEGKSAGNVFNGFDVQIIAEAFNVDTETARRLQGQDDQRGHIIRVESGLQVIRPPFSREEQEREERQQGRSANGLEETICSAKLRENIDNPEHADFYNPQVGRSTNLNSFKFPILRALQLSIERGVLHRNAMVPPFWTLNAHNIVYVTRGSMRMQIVNHQGQAVFDDQLREGQVVVVPQNFAAATQAREEGCRWVSFRTNDNSMTNTLAGRTSAIRAMPVDVIANSYQISREQAQSLKFNREESHMFSPSSRSGRRDDA